MSIPAPNYTPIPNVILDEWMKHLSLIQFKVLIAICRKTFGWHKTRDRISLTQLTEMTGCSRDKVSEALKWLCSKNIITKLLTGTNGQQQALYSINVSADSNKLDQSPMATPPSSLGLPTKETKQKKEDFKALELSETPKPKASPYLKSLQLSHEATNKLKQYPDEAISYAITSHSLMRDKPKDPIPILISLCKKWLKRKAETTQRCPASVKKKLEDLYERTPELKLLVKLDGENFKLEYGEVCMIFQHDQENLHEKIIEAICKINYRTQKMQR